MKLTRRGLLTGVAALAIGHRVPEAVQSMTFADVADAVEWLRDNNIAGPYYYLTPHIGNYEAVKFFLNERP